MSELNALLVGERRMNPSALRRLLGRSAPARHGAAMEKRPRSTSDDDRKPLHPIATTVTAGLVTKDGGVVVEPRHEQAIRMQLVVLLDTGDMEWAVRSLLIVAARLTHEVGASDAADTLSEIAATAAPALWRQFSERVSEKRSDSVFRKKRALPAGLGQAPAKGTIRASHFNTGPRRA